MIPEKVQAFSAVGMVMLSHSGKAAGKWFSLHRGSRDDCLRNSRNDRLFRPRCLGRGAKPFCARVA